MDSTLVLKNAFRVCTQTPNFDFDSTISFCAWFSNTIWMLTTTCKSVWPVAVKVSSLLLRRKNVWRIWHQTLILWCQKLATKWSAKKKRKMKFCMKITMSFHQSLQGKRLRSLCVIKSSYECSLSHRRIWISSNWTTKLILLPRKNKFMTSDVKY